jgi:hypothetical protein
MGDELVLDVSNWTRIDEVYEYASAHCGDDVGEAIRLLVNSGLSQQA